MKTAGLVSISFRKNSPEEIVSACQKAGLSWIEWGSDVHCPEKDPKKASEIRKMCEEAGISTRSYGSYFRLGQGGPESFKPYIEAAKALGSDIIRIWAGTKASGSLTRDERKVLEEEARIISEMAGDAGIKIGMECHSGTITDEYHSAKDFILSVGHPALRMYWQPSQFHTDTYNIDACRTLAPLTEVVHVFHWLVNARLPLEEGRDIWTQYLKIYDEGHFNPAYLLEFMHDDNIETLQHTAEVLKSWLQPV